MEPKENAQIRYQESHFTVESQDDIESECDLSLVHNQSVNISKTSSVVRCSGDINTSVSSINTSILDDTDEVKVLKDKLCELEMKCKYLGNENEKLNNELVIHRNRNQKLEKKLQFVKDNQEVFMRLKEAYINMKYNEACGRKMIEIREKGVQTWEGILCRGCIQAEELRRHVESLRETYNDSFIIASFEMDQLVNTIKYLKDLIDRREKNWLSYLDRESSLQARITGLEGENATLRNILKNRNIPVDEMHLQAEDTEKTETASHKDIMILRKIIVKCEKRFKELEANHPEILKHVPINLNDREKKIVNLIMAKYNARLQRKSTEKLRSHSSRDTRLDSFNSKIIHNLKFGTSCPKFKSTKSDISSSAAFRNTSEGSAILMMDELFSSETKLV